MNRRFIAAFAALSIFFAVMAASSIAYRVLSADAEGRKSAHADFERLASLLSTVRTASDLADPALRARLAAHYREEPKLLLVSVYERGVGIRWRIPSVSPYLPAAQNQRPVPESVYPSRSAMLISAPLLGDQSGRLAVDALYATFGQVLVFGAFRDALLALSLYLLLAAIVITVDRLMATQEKAPIRDPSYDASPPSSMSGPGAGESRASARGGNPPGIDSGDYPPSKTYSPSDSEFEIPEIAEDLSNPLDAEDLVEDLPASGDSGEAQESESFPLPPGLYSPRSGLGWENYLADRLDSELARSASFEQDLSLLLISCDGLSSDKTTYQAVAKALKDFFSFKDLSFENGEEGFAVILPNIDTEHALRMAEEFLKKLTFLLRADRSPLEFLPVFMGLSSRAGRLIDAARITQEAEAAREKARSDRDAHIVAFRPDPEKYRLYLASKGC